MIKKFAKIILWTGIVLLMLIFVTYLVIRIKFPPNKIKQFVITDLENTIKRQVNIGEIWFNPFKGFAITDAIIYEHSQNDTSVIDTCSFFSARKIQLNYHFFSLFKREIEITKILIDQPEIQLKQDQNHRWNFEDLIVEDTTAIEAVPPDTGRIEFSFPFSLSLKKFSLNNFTANIFISQAETVYTIKTGGISVQIDDLFIPRKSIEEFKKKAKVGVKLYTNQSAWQFSFRTNSPSEAIDINSELQLGIDIKVNGMKKIEGSGKIALSNVFLKRLQSEKFGFQQYKFPLPDLTSISFALSSNADEGTLSLIHFTTLVGGETVFDINGNITDFLNQPHVDLEVVNSKINLHKLINSFTPLLPDTLQDQLKNFSVQGIASFKGTKINGNPLSKTDDNGLSFNLLFLVEKFFAAYNDPKANLENLRLVTKAKGIYNLNGVQKTDIWMNVSADTLSIAVDTSNFTFAGLNFDLISTLNSEFLPDSVAADFEIYHFFGVPLNLFLNFKSEDKLNKYQAKGGLYFKELPLRELSGETMEGVVDFALNLHSQSLDQIKLDLNAESDIIELQTETEPLIIYPMDIYGDADLATDTLFERIDLRQMKVHVSDFASAMMHGDFLLGNQQKLNLFIDNLNLDHVKLMAVLPAQFLEGLESLKVNGSTALTSKMSVLFNENQDPVINAEGKISVHAGVEYPEQFLTLRKIDGQLNFGTNGESGKIDLHANLDSLIIAGIQDEPLRNISLVMNGNFPDLETLIIDSSKVGIPDLMTNILLTALIDSLAGNMHVKTQGYLFFDSEDDSVSLLNMLKLSGKLSQKIDFSLNNNIAEITGKLLLNNLNVNYADLAQIDSIVGVVHFAQKFDTEKISLIEDPLNRSFLAEAGSYYYDLLRPYYQRDREKFSNLRIGKIKAMDYYATDINFDLFIFNETFEIPRFSLKAYDGNMSGLIYANLHEGNLDQIEWKIKTNLSRLNSAKLVPMKKLKTKGSDLNMNLELSGIGLDPASQLDVSGYLYVTKIGPQFTDNVLRSLDPKGTDKSIQGTRKLLNWGYKPRLISFEIKHGNLYPTIHLVKANLLTKLIPLNLSGGKIELARIPVKFFLNNLMVESK